PIAPAREAAGNGRKEQSPDRKTHERMRDAAMPGDHQQFVAGNKVAEDVAVREDGAQHQGPGDDARAVHGARGEHVVAPENGFADQRARDSMGNGVHSMSVQEAGCCITLSHEQQRRALDEDFAARAAFAASSEMEMSRPPEVCGSNKRSRYSEGTAGENSAQSPKNSRLFLSPPGRKPSRAASKAPER